MEMNSCFSNRRSKARIRFRSHTCLHRCSSSDFSEVLSLHHISVDKSGIRSKETLTCYAPVFCFLQPDPSPFGSSSHLHWEVTQDLTVPAQPLVFLCTSSASPERFAPCLSLVLASFSGMLNTGDFYNFYFNL